MLAGSLLLSLSVLPPVRAGSAKPGETGIVQKEVERRVKVKDQAQLLIAEGDALAVRGDQCGAADKYRAAVSLMLPGAPATQALRTSAVKKFAVSGVACAKELAETGDYEKARQRLEQVLAADMAPKDGPALTLQKHLKDPDRYNPALSPGHVEDVKKVSNLLMMGEKFTEIGDYKAAESSYNQVLAVDPANSAAQRGLEKTERLITGYLKAARDHTRVRALNEVDRMWETAVPYSAGVRRFAVDPSGGAPIGISAVASKLRTIIIPRLAFSDASMAEVVDYLTKKSAELDASATDERSRGVNIIWAPGEGTPAPVTLSLQNISLGDAIKAVCETSGTHFHADGSVVRITNRGGSALQTRRFRVPPGFLSTSASVVPTDSGGSDPFAGGGASANTKPKLGRLDPQTFLQQQGVSFPEGSRAGYNPSQNLLTVLNTPDNLETIAALVENISSTNQKQVMVQIVLLKCSQTNFQEMGMDLVLESFKAGGGIFASGGTAGNSGTAISAPFNVVDGMVTGGLRSSYELTRQQTIDDLINLSNNNLASVNQNRSPYNMAIGGMFTNPRFQALLRGLNQKKGVDLSVATKTIVKSGQRASAFSGRKFFYPTEFDPPTLPQTAGGNQSLQLDPTTGLPFIATNPLGTVPVTPATPSGFQEKDIGSSIEVEANIGEDNATVNLNLVMQFTEFDGFINYGTPITSEGVILTDNRIIQPVFSRVAANASVQIWDGQTVAVGGLSDNKLETIDDRVPILSSIPIIGKFFKSKLQRSTRTAVIYFVTVSIVDPAGEKIRGTKEVGPGSAGEAGAPGPHADEGSILLPR